MSATAVASSRTLAEFVAHLRYEDLPASVIRRTEELLLDWFGSALAGKGARPVESIARFARLMAGGPGRAHILINRERLSPYMGAIVYDAALHLHDHGDDHIDSSL